jgi:hypothetical protein
MRWRRGRAARLPSPAAKRHVELDRQFHELSPTIDPEHAALESYAAEFVGQRSVLVWEDLLKRRRVVVLGEPGSGKTEELRSKAESLRRSGKDAFYVRLDRLVTESLTKVLGNADSGHLRRWSRGVGSATFFLDSADESKLRRQTDFLTALDRFHDDVGAGLSRSTIIISSRITLWRPATDTYEFKTRLPVPPTTPRAAEGAAEPWIVQIVPLDRDRVKRFAQGLGVDTPGAFIRGLDDANAWGFARRPIDVASLCNYWNRHGRLGTLLELLEADIELKLAETPERAPEDLLSFEQARQGALALGAAVAFCRRFEFSVPDDLPTNTDDTLDAAPCLPEDWPPNLRLALLNRAIFDGASFGRIRFHHRRVAEYLAAQWLEERMAEGCPLTTLEGLLFEPCSDGRVLRPALAPVTAWLVCGEEEWNRYVRKWILEADPALFLHDGDPASRLRPWRFSCRTGILPTFVCYAKRRFQTVFHVTPKCAGHSSGRAPQPFAAMIRSPHPRSGTSSVSVARSAPEPVTSSGCASIFRIANRGRSEGWRSRWPSMSGVKRAVPGAGVCESDGRLGATRP